MASKGTRAPEKLGRQHRQQGVCGLCGFQGKLSDTHVPPQSAGNTGRVRRFHVLSDSDQIMIASAKRVGGIHFYGLCQSCNGLTRVWDDGYGEFAKELWGLTTAAPIHLPRRIQMPSVRIKPGSVARSVLAGCFALNPRLRQLHASTAAHILDASESIELETGTRLFFALTRGPHALVAGGMYGTSFLPSQELDLSSWAQIYFPPLAWQLVSDDECSLLHHQGWADMSSWLATAPGTEETLSDLVGSLPVVVHPRGDPRLRWHWIDVFHDGSCFMVASDNAVRSEWTE